MTRAEARAELLAALVAGGIRATVAAGGDPPYVLVAGGPLDLARSTRGGQVPATFRARCIAGAWDDAASADALDELVPDVLAVLLAADGWRVTSTGDDVIRDYAGSMYLTADVSAERYIDI
jgi:hypothetical protein